MSASGTDAYRTSVLPAPCSQPLPPDTPQHASALYAFIWQAYAELQNEIGNRDIMTLHMGCISEAMQQLLELGISQCFATRGECNAQEWVRSYVDHTRRLLSLPPPKPMLRLYMHNIRDRLGRYTAEAAAAAEAGRNKASRSRWAIKGTSSSSSGNGAGAAAADVLIENLPQQGLLWQGALRYTLSQATLSHISSSSSSSASSSSWRHLARVILLEAEKLLMDPPGVSSMEALTSAKLQNQLELLLAAAEGLSGEQTVTAKVQAALAMLLPEYYRCIWSKKQQQEQHLQPPQQQQSQGGAGVVGDGACGRSSNQDGASLRAGFSSRGFGGNGLYTDIQNHKEKGSSSSSSSEYQDGLSTCSSSSGDGVDHESIKKHSFKFITAMPLHVRLVLAGLVLGTQLSLDAAALVWRFLVEAEQSGGPAWEEDVPLQVVLLLQEAQGMQQAAVQQMHTLVLADQQRSERLQRLKEKKQQQQEQQQRWVEQEQGNDWDAQQQQQQQKKQQEGHEWLEQNQGKSLCEEETQQQTEQQDRQNHKLQQQQQDTESRMEQQAKVEAAEDFRARMGDIHTRVST